MPMYVYAPCIMINAEILEYRYWGSKQTSLQTRMAAVLFTAEGKTTKNKYNLTQIK